MKYSYRYYEPSIDGEHQVVTLTRDEVLAQYWDYWCTQMRRVGKAGEIDEQTCIEDFCVIHWAVEIIQLD